MSQATLADLPIGSVVSFDTYAPAVLGTKYQNVTIVSHLSADDAKALGSDVTARHANIYPALPAGSVNDAYGYYYVKVKLVSGNVDYLGVTWIIKETIKTKQVTKATIVVEDIGPNDVQIIQDILSAADYHNLTITLN